MQTVLQPVLTPRQRRIAALVCNALSNKEIARQIGISEASVKLALHIVYKKLRIASRGDLIYTFKNKLPDLLKDCALDQWSSPAPRTPREVLFKRSTAVR